MGEAFKEMCTTREAAGILRPDLVYFRTHSPEPGFVVRLHAASGPWRVKTSEKGSTMISVSKGLNTCLVQSVTAMMYDNARKIALRQTVASVAKSHSRHLRNEDERGTREGRETHERPRGVVVEDRCGDHSRIPVSGESPSDDRRSYPSGHQGESEEADLGTNHCVAEHRDQGERY